MVKKIFLFGIVSLLIVIIFNTLTFEYQRPHVSTVEALPPLEHPTNIIQRLSRAIQYKTVSEMDQTAVDKEVFSQFHQFLAKAFPLTHQYLALTKINQYSLLYHWQGQNDNLKPVLFMAHQDVVPAPDNTLNRWKYPPFSGHITDTAIFGRGSLDIKSGLIANLEAVESLLRQGFKPARSLYLAYGHDEEVGGKQGAVQIAAYLRSQGVEIEYILDEGGSILEHGVIPGIDSPVAVVGIAEKGYLSLKLTVEATGGHSSMPPKHTAVGVLSQAIVNIENSPLPANMDFSRRMFNRIGPKMPLAQKIIFANMWLTKPLVEYILSNSDTTNATIRTTTAVTMVSGSVKDNILPNVATAVINFRLMPADTVETLKDHISRIVDDNRVTISSLSNFQLGSKISATDTLGFNAIENTIAQIESNPDLVVTPYLVVGATDARHYEKLSDNIYRFAFNRYRPESLKQMHGIDEQIAIKDYLDSIKFYQQLILNSQ